MSIIERRAYLRYTVSVPVLLVDNHSNSYSLMTRDISLGGMSVKSDAVLLKKLLPNGIQTSPSDLAVFNANFTLDDSQELSVLCHVLAVQRLSESDYLIRLTFVDVNETQQNQLQQLLNK